jgi:hypothetical protein
MCVSRYRRYHDNKTTHGSFGEGDDRVTADEERLLQNDEDAKEELAKFLEKK